MLSDRVVGLHWAMLTLMGLLLIVAVPAQTQVDADSPSVHEVQLMYLAYYGRPGDPEGVNYWAGRLDAVGGNWTSDLINAFGTSPEYSGRFAGLSDEALINGLYQRLFNRAPDPGGLAFYLDRIHGTNSSGFNPDGGTSSLARIARDIANGAVDADRNILTNKLRVAAHFTGIVAEKGYAYTADDIDTAIAILAPVSHNQATVVAAQAESNTFVGAGGDSSPPRDSTSDAPSGLSASDTELARTAAGMVPGEFVVLGGDNFQGLRSGQTPDGSLAPAIDTWTSSNYWYPPTQRTYFMGLRVSRRFISYHAPTNSWSEIAFAGKPNAPEQFERFGHMYERIALDKSRGFFYVLDGSLLRRYIIADDRWEIVDAPGFGGQVIEYNQVLDTLICLKDGQLLTPAGLLASTPVDGYHSVLRYNATRGDMMMMGGNASRRTVAILGPDGTVEQKADAPFEFSINTGDLTYDPVTGNYLVVDNEKRFWEYNPNVDEWHMIVDWAPLGRNMPLDHYLQNVPVVIDEHDVVGWQTPDGLILYKHETVLGTPDAPDPGTGSGPKDPPADDPPASDRLIISEAATMQPGEWRNLSGKTTWPGKAEGRSFKAFQVVGNRDGSRGGADGMGWTQDLVYHDGELMLLLMRDSFEHAFIHMASDGTWSRIDDPTGFEKGGRRPFNRLMQDDQYLYFAPRDAKVEMGYMIRTPLESPGVFERYGVPIGDDQMDSTGNFAMEYVPEWGRFYAYTPGAKLWTWSHGEPEWTLLARPPRQLRASGYAGLVHWNPLKQELLAVGGQDFGNGETTGHRLFRITEPFGEAEVLSPMFKPTGEPLVYTAAQSKFIVDPRDGTYWKIHPDKSIWRNETAGGQWRQVGSVGYDEDYPLSPWELYAPYAFVPGTDVIVFVSHIEGVVLYRLP